MQEAINYAQNALSEADLVARKSAARLGPTTRDHSPEKAGYYAGTILILSNRLLAMAGRLDDLQETLAADEVAPHENVSIADEDDIPVPARITSRCQPLNPALWGVQ